MTEELAALLDRQFSFLLEQQGSDLLRELRRTLEMLERDPRFSVLLEEERQELRATLSASRTLQAKTVARAVSVRRRFTETTPALDDSRAPRPESLTLEWLRSLAAFDATAGFEKLPILFGQESDQTVAAQLIEILRLKFADGRRCLASGEPTQEDQHPELNDLQQELLDLRVEYSRAWRRLHDHARTAPGTALQYLERCVEVLSSPRLTAPPGDFQELMTLAHPSWPLPVDDQILYGQHGGRPADAEGLNRVADGVRQALQRLLHGLRLRIGTVRSVNAVFERFKNRCEMHDRDRLRDLASLRDAARNNGSLGRTRAEQALTVELARYLFDQGLNPLTEVPVGVHRADVVEPDRLYVEAKQYSRQNPRSYLLQGTRQVFEMMGRLQASRYRLSEAFFVVFRLAGPLCVFPQEVRFEGWTLRPFVVDLAPAKVSGSRAVRRLQFTEQEIRLGAIGSDVQG